MVGLPRSWAAIILYRKCHECLCSISVLASTRPILTERTGEKGEPHMKSVVLFMTAITAISIASPLLAQEPGDTIVVIAPNEADLWMGNQKVGVVVRGSHLVVEKTGAHWFYARQDTNAGWISRRHVLSLDRALAFFTNAIKENPNCDDYDSRGGVWAVKGRDDLAIADYSEAIRLDPSEARFYVNRGLAYGRKGEHDSAIANFDEAIRLEPRYVDAYLNRAVQWHRKGEYDRAMDDHATVIQLDPFLALGYSNRGATFWAVGERDKAMADFNAAIGMDPKHPSAYVCRGVAWEGRGKYAEAIADYEKAVRLGRKDAELLNQLAWLLAVCPDDRQRDGSKAVEYATQACEIAKWKEPEYLDTLAAAYAEVGDFPKAVKWEEKALSLCSGSQRQRFQTRVDLYRSGKPYREQEGQGGNGGHP